MKILLPFIVLVLCFSAFGQKRPKGDERYKVEIKVKTDSDGQSEMESYLKSELAAISDVDAGSGGDYTIIITLVKIEQPGVNAGFAINYAAVKPVLCKDNIYLDYKDSGSYIADKDNFKLIAAAVVTSFNNSVLDGRRKAK